MALSIREYLQRGPATSKEIQAQTGLSQTAVARKLRRMGADIVTVRQGRTPKYAITRQAFGGDDRLPLIMVAGHGRNVPVAYIRPLAPAGFFVEPLSGTPEVLLGVNKNGFYEDLPYFLYDLAPQGFLGRQIAGNMAARFADFPSDPRRWDTDHIGRYLLANGDDLPGNLKFGQQAFLRFNPKPVYSADVDYPGLADGVMGGMIPGSSAGGEQPKFTAYGGESLGQVIVKFSPRGANDISRRWCDILITEFHAAAAIRARDFQAVQSRLLLVDDRLFLESPRFDRSGEFGRLSSLSLQAIDAEFTGIGHGWPQVMAALCRENLVSSADVMAVKILWCFGRLINNTDMHLGNLSFAMTGSKFRLLPVYDMCCMGFAPRGGGEVMLYRFTPGELDLTQVAAEVLAPAMAMARDFWERVAGDERISAEFKEFLGPGNPMDLLK